MTDEPRLGPPPIEPLSEAAWARVERGLWAQLDAERPTSAPPPRSRRWWLVAAPLTAAAAIAALVVATHRGPSPFADEPYRVVSGTAPTSLSFGDSHIALDAATALVMRHEDAHPAVLLERGAAWFTVAPRLSRPAFIVRAGDAMVRVVGTRFRVARSEERIAVEVDHGLVDVTFRGAMVAVGAGQRWSSDAPGQIMAQAAAPARAAEPAAPTVPEVASEPELEIDPPAPEVAPPARKHAPRPVHRAAGSANAAEPDPAHPAEVDRDREEYDRLAALEPRSPAAALAGYVALARGTGRWAAPALFAAGRLAHDRHDRRAEGLLTIYLQRFPDGANAVDARELLNRLRAGTP